MKQILLITFLLIHTCLGAQTSASCSVYKEGGQYRVHDAVILNNTNLTGLVKTLQMSQLRSYKRANHIPRVIRRFYRHTNEGERLHIAGVGAHYNPGCIIDSYPRNGMTYLGIGNNMVLLSYNSGGIGLSKLILIFRLKAGEVVDFWCGHIMGWNDDNEYNSKEAILDYIAKNMDKPWMLNSDDIYY